MQIGQTGLLDPEVELRHFGKIALRSDVSGTSSRIAQAGRPPSFEVTNVPAEEAQNICGVCAERLPRWHQLQHRSRRRRAFGEQLAEAAMFLGDSRRRRRWRRTDMILAPLRTMRVSLISSSQNSSGCSDSRPDRIEKRLLESRHCLDHASGEAG